MVLHLTAQRRGKLLSFLRRELGLSSSLVKRLKWQGAFLVDGEIAHTDRMVEAGEEITVLLTEDAPNYPAEDGQLDILYEDDALLALDKPAGILMHPSFHRNTGTLANFVAGYYARSGQPCAVHPVSRLDRDTFGVVLLAKNAHVHGLLMAALRRGSFHKTYEALTLGCPDPPQGVWDVPLGRVPGESLLRQVDPAGKPACTKYRALETLGGLARLELTPVTGRTHQLRVHCAHAGCPILGDRQYGSQGAQMGFSGQQLLARSLLFIHPLTEAPLSLESRRSLPPLSRILLEKEFAR